MVPQHVTRPLLHAYMPHQRHQKRTPQQHNNFQHKRITNPTITHADKVVHAVQQVIREIKKLGGIKNSQEAQDLQQLFNGANNYLKSTDLLITQPAPRVNHTQHSIARKSQTDKRILKQSLPRVTQLKNKLPHHNGPPASQT